MTTTQHNFKIGQQAYTVDPHRGSAGAPLALTIMSLLVEPLLVALGPTLANALAGDGDLGALLDDEAVLGSLDFDAVGAALRSAMLRLDTGLICQILRYTNRNGQPLVKDGKPSPHFDAAFCRNYLELGKALWEVCSFNGFIPALPTAGSADDSQ